MYNKEYGSVGNESIVNESAGTIHIKWDKRSLREEKNKAFK